MLYFFSPQFTVFVHRGNFHRHSVCALYTFPCLLFTRLVLFPLWKFLIEHQPAFPFPIPIKLETEDFGGISTELGIGSELPRPLRFFLLPVAQYSERLLDFSAFLSAEHLAPIFQHKNRQTKGVSLRLPRVCSRSSHSLGSPLCGGFGDGARPAFQALMASRRERKRPSTPSFVGR